MMTEEQLTTKYSQQIRELNELLDGGMISQAEYEELAQDVLDVEQIIGDIQTEEMKIIAAKVVDAVSKLVKVI